MSLLSSRLDGTVTPSKPQEPSEADEVLFPIADLRSVDEILAEADMTDDPALEKAIKEIRSNRSQRVYEARETMKAKAKKSRAKSAAKKKAKPKAKAKAKSRAKPKATSALKPGQSVEDKLNELFGGTK